MLFTRSYMPKKKTAIFNWIYIDTQIDSRRNIINAHKSEIVRWQSGPCRQSNLFVNCHKISRKHNYIIRWKVLRCSFTFFFGEQFSSALLNPSKRHKFTTKKKKIYSFLRTINVLCLLTICVVQSLFVYYSGPFNFIGCVSVHLK